MKTNFIYAICGFYIVAYFLVYFTAGYEAAAYLIAALMFGFGVMVFWDWAATAARGARDGGRDPEAILALAFLMLGVYALHTRVVTVAKISLGFPGWLDTHWISQLAGVELLVVFTAIVFAVGRQEREAMPKTSIIRFFIVGFLAGCFLSAIVAIYLLGVKLPDDTPKRPGVGLSSAQSLPRLACDDPMRPVLVNAFCRRAAN